MAALDSKELLQKLGIATEEIGEAEEGEKEGEEKDAADKGEEEREEECEGEARQGDVNAIISISPMQSPLWLTRESVQAQAAAALEASDVLLARLGLLGPHPDAASQQSQDEDDRAEWRRCDVGSVAN